MRTSPGCTKGGREPWRRDISAERRNRGFHVKQPKRTCKNHQLGVRGWCHIFFTVPWNLCSCEYFKTRMHCWTHSCILSNSISTHMPIIWLLCRLVCVFPLFHADKTGQPDHSTFSSLSTWDTKMHFEYIFKTGRLSFFTRGPQENTCFHH